MFVKKQTPFRSAYMSLIFPHASRFEASIFYFIGDVIKVTGKEFDKEFDFNTEKDKVKVFNDFIKYVVPIGATEAHVHLSTEPKRLTFAEAIRSGKCQQDFEQKLNNEQKHTPFQF